MFFGFKCTPLHVAPWLAHWHLYSPFFLSLSFNFQPASKLPCYRSNGFIYQPIKATHIHSMQNDISPILSKQKEDFNFNILKL